MENEKRKDVPIKRAVVSFGILIDAEGQYFDTAHSPNCLAGYSFRVGSRYSRIGTVEVDFHFPKIMIYKMASIPLISDPQ